MIPMILVLAKYFARAGPYPIFLWSRARTTTDYFLTYTSKKGARSKSSSSGPQEWAFFLGFHKGVFEYC